MPAICLADSSRRASIDSGGIGGGSSSSSASDADGGVKTSGVAALSVLVASTPVERRTNLFDRVVGLDGTVGRAVVLESVAWATC